MDTELHHTFAATSETQLATSHIASTPVEVADAGTVKIEVINANNPGLGTDDEVSPELVCEDIVVYGDPGWTVELGKVVGRVRT
jgi:hypothetical protein